MAKTKYMVTSGFLGAGKTTSMLAFARSINARWGKAAILANDLGASNIVDADFTATSDVLTTSIAGNCICYQHENLVDKLRQLVAGGATVIFSDIPGCGIGALDHVYLQLAEREGEEFELMPFTIASWTPERLRMLMEGRGRSEPARGDALSAGRPDGRGGPHRPQQGRPPEQRRGGKAPGAHPHAAPGHARHDHVRRTGEGVDAVVDYLMTHEAAAEHREIGYGSEAFMAAERLLSWYNRRVFLEQREDRNLDFNAVLGDIFEEIRSGLKAKGGNVPHLKMFASGVGEDFFKASLIGVDYPVEYDHKLAAEYSALSVIINARAAAESEAVAAAVDDALDAIAQRYALRERTFFLENFGMMEEGRGNGGRASRY